MLDGLLWGCWNALREAAGPAMGGSWAMAEEVRTVGKPEAKAATRAKTRLRGRLIPNSLSYNPGVAV